jgi:hypothetical protein
MDRIQKTHFVEDFYARVSREGTDRYTYHVEMLDFSLLFFGIR